MLWTCEQPCMLAFRNVSLGSSQIHAVSVTNTCSARLAFELNIGDPTAQQTLSAGMGTLGQSSQGISSVETDYNDRVQGYESWWDVAIAEVSTSESVTRLMLSTSERSSEKRTTGFGRVSSRSLPGSTKAGTKIVAETAKKLRAGEI